MESYTGPEYARYYLHGEHLVVDGKPMSKSRGNIVYPEDIYRHGCRARDLRLFLFHTHYRKKLNFTKTVSRNPAGEWRLLHDCRCDSQEGRYRDEGESGREGDDRADSRVNSKQR